MVVMLNLNKRFESMWRYCIGQTDVSLMSNENKFITTFLIT